MFKRGDKVKFIGTWGDSTFLKDQKYYNNKFDVLCTYAYRNEQVLVIKSHYNIERTDAERGLISTKYWKLDVKDFIKINQYGLDDFNNKLDDILGDI